MSLHDVPIHPDIISIAFLLLPANNVQQALLSESRTFGVHYLTVLTACQFLTSETKEGVVSMDPEGILTLKQYYYRLINLQTDPHLPLVVVPS